MTNRLAQSVVGRGRRTRKLYDAPGEIETYPDWVPGMDIGHRFARISLKTVHLRGFDHTAIWLAKVRNVSSVGRQSPTYWYRWCPKYQQALSSL